MKTGYDVWLKYERISTPFSKKYKERIKKVIVLEPFNNASPSIIDSAFNELTKGIRKMVSRKVAISKANNSEDLPLEPFLLVSSYTNLPAQIISQVQSHLIPYYDGYCIISIIVNEVPCILISSLTERGVLYGTFAFLRFLQQGKSIENLNIVEEPKITWRMLNHWDNLDGTVEHGYSGKSIWKWDELPSKISKRYYDYGRICASIGINAISINNVHADARIFSDSNLKKISAVAKVLNLYGIKIFLAVGFDFPVTLGDLTSIDIENPSLGNWWQSKIVEIYTLIPNLGGFIIQGSKKKKQDITCCKKNMIETANLIGQSLKMFGGILVWRGSIYNHEDNMSKTAYSEYKSLDGKFNDNVVLQVKAGAINFQPCEPANPILGNMKRTATFLEMQISQQYLGKENHIVFLAPMWKKLLDFDTHAYKRDGGSVGKLLSLSKASGITGIANIGDDDSWCGSLFHAANLFAFGRLAWDYTLEPLDIANEWTLCTWGNDSFVWNAVMHILMHSWETAVNYTSPMGLIQLTDLSPFYESSLAYLCDDVSIETLKTNCFIDKEGIGFERTAKGSNAVSQYYPANEELFSDMCKCPKEFLLFFHHVPWNFKLDNGKSLKEELFERYCKGAEDVKKLKKWWLSIKDRIDPDIFDEILRKINIQINDANEWKNENLYYLGKIIDG